MKKLLALTSLVLPCLSFAGEVGVRISDDAITLRGGSGFNQNNASFDIGWVHNNSRDRDVINAGLYLNDEVSSGVNGRMGAKLYQADVESADGYGLALGGQASLDLNLNYKLRLVADLYWGPGSLAFNDIDRYVEWSVGWSFEPIDNGEINFGYAALEVDTKARDDVRIDKGFFLGMKMKF